MWLHHVHIPPYAPATATTTRPSATRKLLLHRREIERLAGQNERARPDARADADLLLEARARRSRSRSRSGKDRFDKRESIKTREMARDVQRELRDAGAEPALGVGERARSGASRPCRREQGDQAEVDDRDSARCARLTW